MEKKLVSLCVAALACWKVSVTDPLDRALEADLSITVTGIMSEARTIGSLPSSKRDMVVQVGCEHVRLPIDVIVFYKAQESATSTSGQWSLT